MKTPSYPCPICTHVSPRSQGISAHVRSRHPEHWSRYGPHPATAVVTISSATSAQTSIPAGTHLAAAIAAVQQELDATTAHVAELERQLAALEQAKQAIMKSHAG